MASYYALRRCPGDASDEWWVNVSARRDAPRAIQALLAGRARVELSSAETIESLTWADQFSADEPPLAVYPHDPRVNGR
jgi:hypothetical protein